MKNPMSVLKFQLFSIVFTLILGTLFHYTYEWSNNNLLVSLFSAVNESSWEHLKLVFFPMLIVTIIGYLYFRNTVPNFLCAKAIGIIVAMLFIITFFYTYTGILGTNIGIINVASFFVAVILGEYLAYVIMFSSFKCNKRFYITSLAILTVAFIIFTFLPPRIGLFKDPVTNTYGISLNKY